MPALLFKVICNATHFLDHNWFFSLEFSGASKYIVLIQLEVADVVVFYYRVDVLVPFFVFCSCLIGLCMVALAASQCGEKK